MTWNESLRSEWAAAGYSRMGGSVCIMRPPSQEFLRVYHLTSADYAISSLALSRIKVARFLDLNDPFELMALNLHEHRTRNIIVDFKNAKNSDTGLLCFSSHWTNPVLWSHYGARHSGVCLGFDLRRSIHPQKVEYQDRRIREHLPSDGNPVNLDSELQEILLKTKYSHWSYEEEIRVFVKLKDMISEGALHFFPFNETLQLVEVILGVNCILSLGEVRELVQTRHPKAITFKSRLAYNNFSVVPDECSLPK